MRLIDVTLDQLRDMICEVVREVVREELSHAPAPKPSGILTTDEAAAHARRSPETIRDWIQSGRLKALPRSGRQHYRIRLEELEAAMARQPDLSFDQDEWVQRTIAEARSSDRRAGHPSSPPPPDAVWLSIRQVAERVNRSPVTVHGWIRDGHVRAFRNGGSRGQWRIAETDLEAAKIAQPEAPPDDALADVRARIARRRTMAKSSR